MTEQIQQRAVIDILAIQDKTKAPIALIPPDSIREIARVFEFGALKYAPDNWKAMLANGKRVQFIEAIIRHALRLLEGEVIDPESGRSHAAHIACNGAMLDWFSSVTLFELDKFKKQDLLCKEGHQQ